MSGVMPYEEEIKVLGIPLTLKMIMHSQRELTIVGIKYDGKFHNLFVYRSDIDALQADEAEVSKLADDYALTLRAVPKFTSITVKKKLVDRRTIPVF